MKACEDCGDDVKRRTTCSHCGKKICGWCLHHVHNSFMQGPAFKKPPAKNKARRAT